MVFEFNGKVKNWAISSCTMKLVAWRVDAIKQQ